MELYLNPVSGTKEGWRSDTSHQPEMLQYIRGVSTLQNVRYMYTDLQEPRQKRRLASEGGPKGCLFLCPDRSGSQEISVFQTGIENLPVHLPPIRPNFNTMGFYQDPQTDSSSRTRAGIPSCDLHRRYTADGMAGSREMAQEQGSALVFLLQCLGFTVNPEKTVLQPTQTIELLGFDVNTLSMELSLPTEKLKKIRASPDDSRKLPGEGLNRLIAGRSFSRLIGKINAANQVIPPAPLFYRRLQMDLTEALRKANQNYDTRLRLSEDRKEELVWWDTQMVRWNGKTIMTKDPKLIIESDA